MMTGQLAMQPIKQTIKARFSDKNKRADPGIASAPLPSEYIQYKYTVNNRNAMRIVVIHTSRDKPRYLRNVLMMDIFCYYPHTY